jgi:hypothetical protein
MWLIFVEAGVALFLLVFIVWWTMSGKKPDDLTKSRPRTPQQAEKSQAAQDTDNPP